ncbi:MULTISPECIES: hypothetical protein [Bacillaceae]|uniref:Uncharacterized protein n=1 Tax=Alkalicoccobacillus plakortidis TaxID=444060 RepID=A0A9D5DPE5_9BACI|nr:MULTISPECIES: hypothetical protein [Bacillaceae]KQL57844.1 hypothetical protein AN965_05845 [Alkalicoccobacillus plakortidis]
MSQQEDRHKLASHGMVEEPSSFIFSSTVTAFFIKTQGLGEDVLLTKISEETDFVVITTHDEMTYSELKILYT